MNNGRKFFVPFFFGGVGGGGYLGFHFLGFFFFLSCFCYQMVPLVCLSSVQDTLYPFCYGIYILGNLLKHVNSAHPFAILVPRLTRLFFFACVFPFYASSWFYYFYFLGLVLGLV